MGGDSAGDEVDDMRAGDPSSGRRKRGGEEEEEEEEEEEVADVVMAWGDSLIDFGHEAEDDDA